VAPRPAVGHTARVAMRYLPFLVLLAVGCHASDVAYQPSEEPLAVEPQPPNELATKLEAFFDEATQAGKFTGTVIAIDHGKTVLSKSFGQADRKANVPNAEDTIFRIGSLSKQFTASAILALAKDGKLAVTDPVSKFFPEYPKANLTKDGTEVTLHHLLSQTSGLPNPEATEFFKTHAWFQRIEPAQLIDAIKDTPLVTQPGTTWAYLNYNYFLLGLVVERVSGMSYEAFLETRYFESLGMTDTGTIMRGEKKSREAIGYFRLEDGTFVTLADEPTFIDRDLTLVFGSGQVYTTLPDLVRWDRALAAGKIAGQEQLFQPNLANYGYGWVIADGFVWHNGALSPLGFSSLMARVPSKDRMVAYLSNLDIGVTAPLQGDVLKLTVATP
jgi:CubicO group peptidase (beta-lactamase class C family)